MCERVWDKKKVVENILTDIELPRMVRIKQKMVNNQNYNICDELNKEINKPECIAKIQVGMKIAVGIGSRGIANIDIITKQTIDILKDLGAEPFIIPAMGSHGGAEAAGQKNVLSGLGITEKTMGVPIDASMEVIKIDTLFDGREVFISKSAVEADGIIIINRIKPHTSFHGTYESGLVKMMAIGLGKQHGAASCHTQGFKKMAENVPLYGLSVLNNSPILFGIAIIENEIHEISKIVAIPKERIECDEPELLKEAKSRMASIPFEDIDVLVVDEIGKNHSGDGMDPNVTGSYCTPYAEGPPIVSKYVVLDASEETHGNTLGIGMADFTTKRLFEKTDFDTIYPNSLTSKVPSVSKMPMVLNSDKLAIKAAVMTCDSDMGEGIRIVRIKNSSHVEEMWISEYMLDEAENNPDIEIIEDPEPFKFNTDGELSRPYKTCKTGAENEL